MDAAMDDDHCKSAQSTQDWDLMGNQFQMLSVELIYYVLALNII